MLTAVQINQTEPTGKAFRLYDAHGLYLQCAKNFDHKKGRSWRFKYQFNNKEKLLTIGGYPQIGLKEARRLRDEARLMVNNGICPATAKAKRKQAEDAPEPVGKTFRESALLWCDYKALPGTKNHWKESHKKNVIRELESNVFGVIGGRVVHTILSDDIDAVLQPIEERGAYELLAKTINRIDSIFRYGVFKKWCDNNPAYGRSEFIPKSRTEHMAYVAEAELPAFLRDLESYDGYIITKMAIKFVLLTHARTNEVRFATWSEIDFDKRQWYLSEERMKRDTAQTIPLSRQAVELLSELYKLTGNYEYLFTSLWGRDTSKPISENGMLSTVKAIGWQGRATVHGLRSTYSTIANETLKFRHDAIEADLSHKVKDPIRGSYNHATYLEERTENIQAWADYLEKISGGVT